MHRATKGDLKKDFDSAENAIRLIDNVGKKSLPGTGGYCIERAGFSAITQMELAIRRAIEKRSITNNKMLNLKPEAQPYDHSKNLER